MRAAVLPLMFTLTGCFGSDATRDLEEVQNQTRMAAHAEVVDAVRIAVIRGHLPSIHAAAQAVKLEAPAGLPAEQGAFHQQVVAGLAEIGAAKSVDQSAAALGKVGAACGACHAAAGVKPAAPPPPPVGEDIEAAMARHAWAVDALWLGLLGAEVPVDPGTVLTASSLVPSGLPTDSAWSPLANELAVRAADLATRAGASAGEARGERTGELLSTCAACHALTKGGPAKDWRPMLALDIVAWSAAKTLGGRMKAEVVGSIGRDGPGATVPYCQQVAPAVAKEVLEQTGVTVGRSSLRLRNPGNAGPQWVQDQLQAWGERPAAQATPYIDVVEVDGAQVGRVALPIEVEGACLTCHGAPDALAPGVSDALKAAYPEDRATGYAPGDLRGLLWAETSPVR